MTTSSHGRIEAYHALQRQCREAVHHGRLERAAVLARRALLVASHSGSSSLLHQATTTHSMVLLELGKIAEAEKGLREVVLASTDDETICRAAFYLASSLRRQKRLGKAHFFASAAVAKAHGLGDAIWRARCHNLLGNIELNRGGLEAALDEYRRALAIWESQPGDHRFALAIVLDNLGYCLTLQKKIREACPILPGLWLAPARLKIHAPRRSAARTWLMPFSAWDMQGPHVKMHWPPWRSPRK